MMERKKPLLEMQDIHAYYGEVHALRGVDFNLFQGEIHALTGEHRAGKSSLIKILSGAEQARSGSIFINGKKVGPLNPRTAMKYRIGTVYQAPSIIPDLEPLEFIFTHQFPTSLGMITHKKMEYALKELMETYGLSFNPHSKIRNLPADQQVLVEFMRALIINPEILILDDFTNKLTPNEMQKIYQIISLLKKQGCGIIYVSHDIQEVIKLADRVTILNQGRRLETDLVANLDSVRLYELTYSFTIDKLQTEQLEKFQLFNNHIRKIIQEIPLGILILDNDMKIQTMNLQAKRILDYDFSTTNSSSWFLHFLEKVFPSHHEEILETLTKGKTARWRGVETGQDNTLEVQVSPIRDEGMTSIGSLIILQDNTLDDSLEDYLMKSEKFASLAEVAVGVAHEINNPLFAIKNYIELISMKNDNLYIKEKIQTINLELDRIVRTISSLLDFSKIRTDSFQPVNLSALLEDVLLLLNHRLNAKHIRIIRNIQADVIIQKGMDDKLKQLFINLIVNSIDAILDFGQINVELYTTRTQVVVKIKDNGNGIPEEIRAKIFEPFYSTKVNKYNTGLGLAIAKHIVDSHQGTIEIQDDKQYKTCLCVKIAL
ncbi:MAG: ATP-binding cassette domain-containing protein [Sphaerochaeta sp.]|nr:ATP-binding cassette domain-containing protein [Sphaerochaeta sp.]